MGVVRALVLALSLAAALSAASPAQPRQEAASAQPPGGGAGSDAAARPDQVRADPQAAPCALHVWPSGRVRSVTHGDWSNQRVDEALKGGPERPAWSAAALATDQQRVLLAELPLARLFGMAGAPVTIHETPQRAFQARQATGRLAPDREGCLSEVVLLDLTLEAAPMAPRSLRLAALRRDFPAGQAAPMRRFETFVTRSLTTLPRPCEPAEFPVDAVDAELAAAFRLNVEEFARRDEAARRGRPMTRGGRP